MKLYLQPRDGFWAGTQADAKKLGGGWTLVEVPTDKPGLLEFLNKHGVGRLSPAERLEVPEGPVPALTPGAGLSEAFMDKLDAAVDRQKIEDVWPQLPLSFRFHLAALAMEDAREIAWGKV